VNIDPLAAALNALVAHLATALPTASVRRGWPESDTALDVDAGPVVSVLAIGSPVVEACSPGQVDETGTDTLTTTFRVGYWRARVQVDLWTAYRAQRDELGAAVDAALANRAPRSPDLWLTSTGYHDRPLTFRLLAVRVEDGPDAAPTGLWRSGWDLEVRSDRVAIATAPALLEVEVDLTTSNGADIAETITITS
jgi:hypothetical protein